MGRYHFFAWRLFSTRPFSFLEKNTSLHRMNVKIKHSD